MNKTVPHSDVLRLIRFTGFLWLVYLSVLAIISWLYQPQPITNILYYILLAYVAVICLGLAYWRWIQEVLGRLFIPLVVSLITIIPIIINWLLVGNSPFDPRFSTSEGTLLGLLPFMLIALLLVAWQYKWRITLLVIVVIAGLNAGLIWLVTKPSRGPVQGVLMLTLVQTIIFLAVGFSVTYLVSTLRKNQKSLEDANIQLTHYASTLEHLATSRERNRLAHELHDTLAHTLSGLSVQLETVKAYWDVDPQAARTLLDDSSAIARSGLEETRRALKALRASQLDDLGLSQAVGIMAKDAAERGRLSLRLSVADNLPVLSPDVEQCVYRIAQEAIQNAIIHSAAKHLKVDLSFAAGKTTLVVSDDGVGFALGKGEKANHFGVSGMEERAKLAGGELAITSSQGCGTTIKLTV